MRKLVAGGRGTGSATWQKYEAVLAMTD